MNINVEIGRLVLEGISVEPHQRSVLKATLEAELGKLLAEHGLASQLQRGSAINTVRTGSIHVGERNEPLNLGRHIARSVYGMLNR